MKYLAAVTYICKWLYRLYEPGKHEALLYISCDQCWLLLAATNLLAIAIANKDQGQATDILSDAIGIALVFGVLFGVATYLACPSILRAMTGAASTDLLGPAITYVKIRQAIQPSEAGLTM